MGKKRTINEEYWDMVRENQLKEEYSIYLKDKNLPPEPETAQLFAMYKKNNGFSGLSEREIIMLLAGRLPYMYD